MKALSFILLFLVFLAACEVERQNEQISAPVSIAKEAEQTPIAIQIEQEPIEEIVKPVPAIVPKKPAQPPVTLKYAGRDGSGAIISVASCPKAAQTAIKVADLELVRDCKSEPIVVDGREAELVTIQYGEGGDCPAGCIFSGYYGVVQGSNVSKFYRLPDPFMMYSRFGRSCAAFDYGNDHPGYTRTIVTKDGRLVWKVIFESFKPQAYPGHWKFEEYAGTICVLNGSAEFGSAYDSFDFTQLQVSYPQIDTCDNVASSRQACIAWDGSSQICARNNCLTNIAIARNDSSVCSKIQKEADFRSNLPYDWCYSGVAVSRSDANLCAVIVDEGIREQCYSAIGRYARDASTCSLIEDEYYRKMCVRQVADLLK